MEEKSPCFQYLVTGPKSCLIESSYFINVGFIMLVTAFNKSNLVKTLVGFIEVCWIQYYKTEGLKITCNNMKSNPCL